MKNILLILFLVLSINLTAQDYKDGKYLITITNHDCELLNFTDSLVSIEFTPDNLWFKMKVKNKTQEEMFILWDTNSFIIDNEAYPVRPEYVPMEDLLYKPIKPTFIPPGSYVKKVMQAMETPVFPMTLYRANKIKNTGAKYFSYYLALKINGEKKNYKFDFKVTLPGRPLR